MPEEFDWEPFVCGCGVQYWLHVEHVKDLRRSHKTFYCPNGCSRHFPQKNKEEVLKEQLACARNSLEYERRRADLGERRRRAAKGQLTKFQKKIARGECPCCGKQFNDLRRHMHAEHADWLEEHGETVKLLEHKSA